MKKRIFVIAITLIIVVSLVGCGGSKDNVSEPSSQNEQVVSEPEEKDNESVETKISVTVEVDGKKIDAEVPAGSVQDVLKAASIDIGKDDVVDPAKTTELKDGDYVKIVRVTFKEEEEVVDVPFETEYVPDSSIYEGDGYYIQEGINGVTKHIYKITFHDGVEVLRELDKSEEVTVVQNEIYAYGTLVYEEPSSGGGEEDPEACIPVEDDANW